MAAPGQPVLSVYPVTNYSFGRKEAKYEKDSNVAARMERLKDKCAQRACGGPGGLDGGRAARWGGSGSRLRGRHRPPTAPPLSRQVCARGPAALGGRGPSGARARPPPRVAAAGERGGGRGGAGATSAQRGGNTRRLLNWAADPPCGCARARADGRRVLQAPRRAFAARGGRCAHVCVGGGGGGNLFFDTNPSMQQPRHPPAHPLTHLPHPQRWRGCFASSAACWRPPRRRCAPTGAWARWWGRTIGEGAGRCVYVFVCGPIPSLLACLPACLPACLSLTARTP